MRAKVFQGGTYTGNVVSTAAADATLEFIQTGKVFEQINMVGGMLIEGMLQGEEGPDIPFQGRDPIGIVPIDAPRQVDEFLDRRAGLGTVSGWGLNGG